MLSVEQWFESIGKRSRPYQVRSIEKAEAALAAGKVPLIVAPTGAGKTVIARGVLRNHMSAAAALVHTRTLRDQSRNSIPGALIQTIQGLTQVGGAADARRRAVAATLRAFVDEAHHIVSEEWVQAYNCLRSGGVQVFGATATPERADGTPLGDVFDVLISETNYSELVRDGNLVPCDIASPEHSRKEQRKKKIRPDAVASYLKHGKREDGTFRPGIYFDRTKDDCYEASARFELAGVRTAVVTCDTGTHERQGIFDAYTRGELDMLLSPQALAEGFDSRRAEVCVLNRTAAHVGGFLQMVGRVLRPYAPNYIEELQSGVKLTAPALRPKDRALLIDCTDATSVHGKPTADRIYSLDGCGIELAPTEEEIEKETQERAEAERARMVDMQYRMIRDQLRDVYTDLTTKAKERDYKRGWVFHRFTEATGMAPPREFTAEFSSVCKHCRARIPVGSRLFWAGPSLSYHEDCWFDSINKTVLLAADAKQPKARRVMKDA